ncbi:MAG: hypothetical protein ABIR56_14260 [Polaromonas sp.]
MQRLAALVPVTTTSSTTAHDRDQVRPGAPGLSCWPAVQCLAALVQVTTTSATPMTSMRPCPRP